ncbi:MAG: phosphatase [Rhodothermales bacterium]|nr:phosphatase [Rhodothermales bacterium]
MNYVNISPSLSTSGQITYDQISSLKEEGYEIVINLAPASEAVNALEGFLVIQEGMTYVHIPVSWREPSMRDVKMFFDTMEANRDRKVFVHCFANMRVSVFVYLYRTLIEGVTEAEAMADLTKVWDPEDQQQWTALIEQARSELSN